MARRGWKRRLLTREQDGFVRDAFTRMSLADVTARLNERFGTDFTRIQIKGYCSNHGITCGDPARQRWQRGLRPWNQGLAGKGVCKSNGGSFKKGEKPRNWMPVGAEVVNGAGYLVRKMNEDPDKRGAERWAAVHRLAWVEANGPVPRGHRIVFLDGDRMNIALDNLLCVPIGVVAMFNKKGLHKLSGEVRAAAWRATHLEWLARKRGGDWRHRFDQALHRAGMGCTVANRSRLERLAREAGMDLDDPDPDTAELQALVFANLPGFAPKRPRARRKAA